MNPEFLQDRAITRSNVYGFLERVYSQPPDEEFLQSLAEWITSLLKTSEFNELPWDMQECVMGLGRLFSSEPIPALSDKTGSDFTKLFRGIKKQYPPPPYESVYIDGQTFGETTDHVHQCYREMGVDISGDKQNNPPDFIAFELEFMQLLCEKEAAAWEKKAEKEANDLVEVETEFLSRHLLNWVPDFCDRIVEHDSFGFFKYLTVLTREWIRLDYAQIN